LFGQLAWVQTCFLHPLKNEKRIGEKE